MNFPIFIAVVSDFGNLFHLSLLKFLQMGSLSVAVISLLEDRVASVVGVSFQLLGKCLGSVH